jgi:ParB-like chromosome segregation protein Spo0J
MLRLHPYHGDFVLIAGERRYRAAIKAALMELPRSSVPPAMGTMTSRPSCSPRR